jgi:hypothetical protein
VVEVMSDHRNIIPEYLRRGNNEGKTQ